MNRSQAEQGCCRIWLPLGSCGLSSFWWGCGRARGAHSSKSISSPATGTMSFPEALRQGSPAHHTGDSELSALFSGIALVRLGRNHHLTTISEASAKQGQLEVKAYDLACIPGRHSGPGVSQLGPEINAACGSPPACTLCGRLHPAASPHPSAQHQLPEPQGGLGTACSALAGTVCYLSAGGHL